MRRSIKLKQEQLNASQTRKKTQHIFHSPHTRIAKHFWHPVGDSSEPFQAAFASFQIQLSNPPNIKIARYSINFCDLSLYLRFGQIRPKSVRLLGEVISSSFLIYIFYVHNYLIFQYVNCYFLCILCFFAAVSFLVYCNSNSIV